MTLTNARWYWATLVAFIVSWLSVLICRLSNSRNTKHSYLAKESAREKTQLVSNLGLTDEEVFRLIGKVVEPNPQKSRLSNGAFAALIACVGIFVLADPSVKNIELGGSPDEPIRFEWRATVVEGGHTQGGFAELERADSSGALISFFQQNLFQRKGERAPLSLVLESCEASGDTVHCRGETRLHEKASPAQVRFSRLTGDGEIKGVNNDGEAAVITLKAIGNPGKLTALDTVGLRQPQRSVTNPVRQVQDLVGSWRIGLLGIGPVRVGMTPEEAGNALGRPLVRKKLSNSGCDWWVPGDGTDGLAWMVVDGKIATSRIWRPGVETRSGVGIGDPETKVMQAYPDQIEVSERKYSGGMHQLIFRPKDPSDQGYRVVFITNRRTVQDIQAGRHPEVEYGCPEDNQSRGVASERERSVAESPLIDR